MRVLLVPNTLNAEAVNATVELAVWCLGKGLEPMLATSDAAACGLDAHAVSPADIGEPVLAVALGGDGTILKAVHLLGDVSVPLLGIKFGRLGFLSGSSPADARDAIESALAGEARIERRATLRAQIEMSGRNVGSYRSLNEVSVSRGSSGRIIAPDIIVGGNLVARMRSDGIIIATATGSTAYALSAGGPIVAPGFGGMVIVPVAPHTLCTRPLLTDPSETVEIRFNDSTRNDAGIMIDGYSVPSRGSLEGLVVARSEHDVLLVKYEGRGFYETVAQEFFGS